MLMLGVDTSGKHGSIALVRIDSGIPQPKAFDPGAREEQPQSFERTTSHTLEVFPLEGGTFSAQLVPQISKLLQKHGLTKYQIDGFAVVSGPGSFTGLRVGLAAIKALAEILQKPIATVSLLEAVATAAEMEGTVLSAIEAGRGEVYVGTYDVRSGTAMCISEQILPLEEFVAQAAGNQVITPDQKVADAAKHGSTMVHRIEQLQADSIACLGFLKLRAGQTVSPEALEATYVRRSDAEIKFAERTR